MGRAELRRQKREAESGQTKYTLTKAQIDEMLERHIQEYGKRYVQEVDRQNMEYRYSVHEFTLYEFSVMAMWILHDWLHLSYNGLLTFVNKLNDLDSCILSENVSINDMRDQIKEETGIDIMPDTSVDDFFTELEAMRSQVKERKYRQFGKTIVLNDRKGVDT